MNIVSCLLPLIVLIQPSPGTLTADIHAAHESIQPGGTTDLAIEINVQEDWYINHPVAVGTGAPATISFEAPRGVTFGELQFPAPFEGKDGDVEYLFLDGRVLVLSTLTIDPDIKPGPLTIRTIVYAVLSSEQQRVPFEAMADLTIDVSDATPAPANQELFEEARATLPVPLNRAPYITGSRITISPEKITPDQKAEILFTGKVQSGHHIQDRDPGTENLIASRLYIEPIPGLTFQKQQWSEAHVRNTQVFGKIREQSGQFTIRAPFSIEGADFPSGPVALRVLFTYQTCTDAGMCFPPETAEAVVRFTADTPTEPTPGSRVDTLYPIVTTVDRVRTVTASETGTAGIDWRQLLKMLAASFLGGLILNVMPCVFPVISIKILSFVKQAGEDRARVLKLGLTFAAGIMVWFWIFAALTAVGQIPWQHPWVVIGLTALIFLFALNLLGVFEIILPGAAAGKLDEVSTREGYPGAFLKGLLATLLGTACTAPFFATAAAFAATQPASISFVIFTGAGLGMASPYIVLSAFPGWLAWLPKPGQWMVIFKQVMGFVLAGTAVWLLLIVGDLLDARGVVWTVAFLGFLALAAWLIGQIKPTSSTPGRSLTWASAVVVALFGGWFSFGLMYDVQSASAAPDPNHTIAPNDVTPEAIIAAVKTANWDEHIPWQPYRPGLPEELSNLGYTVYVDYTATWCVTCQTNKAVAMEVSSTREKLQKFGVIPIRVDYTRDDATIRKQLLAFGHNSVPLNLIYPAGRPDEVIKLPILLTPGLVADALDRAGPSTAERVSASAGS